MTIDESIFFAINGLALQNPVLDKIGVFFADTFVFVLPFIVFLIWWRWPNLRKHAYLAVGSVIVSRFVIAEIIKRLVERPRPFENLSVHQLIMNEETGMSFPSGHTVIYFAIAFSFYGTKWFWPFFVLALIGSVARVFVGVHYPSDVVVGFIIALLTVWSIRILFKRHFLG